MCTRLVENGANVVVFPERIARVITMHTFTSLFSEGINEVVSESVSMGLGPFDGDGKVVVLGGDDGRVPVSVVDD